MPNRTIYVSEDIVEKFDSLPNKSEFVRNALTGYQVPEPLDERIAKLERGVKELNQRIHSLK